MTIQREKKKIDECIWLLNAPDKEIGDKYNKDASRIGDYRMTRIEAILQVISDDLAEEIQLALEEAQAKAAEEAAKIPPTIGNVLKMT